ncbi:TPA: cation:proton antiporter, partial [Candidatus Woesearchaeota archaeon]|nr:cation:proton antiporter [Candidatus Woesearchaeota archaeon]
ALSVCFIFSIVFSYLGFSIAIGAFVAGVALANLTYNVEIIAKVKSLKDFFSTLFFVSLGLGITIPDLRGILKPLILLTLVVILVKPLVVMFLCSFFGYTKKVSFLTALSLAQVSEFSIIIATLGLELGHISQNLFTITVLLIIITLILTAYFIKFDFLLYSFFSRWLNVFDLMNKGEHLQYLPQKQQDLDYDVILVGYDRIGYNVLKALERLKHSFIVIDYNPDLIKRLVLRKIPCIYGDIGDDEIMERLNFKHAKLVISTIPTPEDNKRITKHLRAVNKKAVLFVTANVIEEAMELYKLGADYVVLPHFLGGERVSTLVEEYSTDLKKVIKNKLAHIDELRDRLSLSQEHPLKA